MLLLFCLVLATPLAYADTPDPSWVDGYYDGADEDDALIALQAISALVVDVRLTPSFVVEVAALTTAVLLSTPATARAKCKDRAPPMGMS